LPLLGSGPQTTTEEWCFLRDPINNNQQQQRNGIFCAVSAEASLETAVRRMGIVNVGTKAEDNGEDTAD
jgi:hypothetical protein